MNLSLPPNFFVQGMANVKQVLKFDKFRKRFHILCIQGVPRLYKFCTCTSVNSVVEFPGAGLGRLITINSELNGAI